MSAGQKRAPGVGAQGASDEQTELNAPKAGSSDVEVKQACNAMSDTPKLGPYFGGKRVTESEVVALPVSDFAALVRYIIRRSQPIDLTKEEFLALPENERKARKRTRYIVPCSFRSNPSPRKTEEATDAHLLCIDIDDSDEAKRLLSIGIEKAFGNLNAIVWHTASSAPDSPRLRVIAQTKAVSVPAYPSAAMALARMIGMTEINKESKIPVQPMYLPLAFKGATESPVIYTKTDGEDFDPGPITSASTAPNAASEAIDEYMGDISYLSPRVEGVSEEDARADLRMIPADCPMQQWVEVGMALKHQFGEAGFALWDEWSDTAPHRYPGSEAIVKRWESFAATPKGRQPVTYRKVQWLRRANEPQIILPGGDVSIIECAEILFSRIATKRDLFYRGGLVHEVVRSHGEARLSPLNASQFRSRIENYGQILAWRAGADHKPVLKPTTCPEQTAKALLESEPARRLLPGVTMLSSCPILTADGAKTRVIGEGWYGIQGGIYVTGGAIPPAVGLAEALKSLLAILADYQFASSGDRSRAIAAMISPALRMGGWLTSQLPVDIAEADQSQSGKGYRQKINAAVYREVPNLVVQKSGGVGGFDESLSQKLIDGRPFILLDNLRGKLDSPFFEAVLTAPGTTPARVPHRGEVQVDARGYVFQITSNGVETTRDLANRASIVRIRKQPVGYLFKKYPEGTLHAHVVANQPYYLGCVFAVIKEWVRRGKPRTEEARHDFREWAQTLDWIVQNLFQSAPLIDGLEEARERVSDLRRSWIRAIAIVVVNSGKTGRLTASDLAEIASDADTPPPGVRENADEGTYARTIGRVFAANFGVKDEIEVDGYKVARFHATGLNGNDTKSYEFTHPSPNKPE